MVKVELIGVQGLPFSSKVMHIFINEGNDRCWFDVYLKDGFCPCIGDQRNRSPANAAPIEPAIWCKVLVLDSISIDCSRRLLKWSTTCCSKDETLKENQFIINDECSGYDTEDELFDLARAILDKSRQDVAEDDFKMSILRMLHCFVLPKVSFSKKDMARVEVAKDDQIKSIKSLDAKIKAKCYEVIEGQKELFSKREMFLPEIVDLIENKHCDKPFLETLLKDLEHEEKKIRLQVDLAQGEVDYAKSLPIGSSQATGSLHQAREKRNAFQNKLELLVTGREEILDCIGCLTDEPKKPIKVLQEYSLKRSIVEQLKEERQNLTQQKNCALSVREMLDQILSDLETKGFSEGNDADSTGQRATDVLQNVWYPEWQKLSERVATIVLNPEHPVGESFDKFCTEVRERCKEVIGLGHLRETTMNIQGSNMSIISIGSNDIPPEDRLGPASYGLSDYVVESYRVRLNELKDIIFDHLEKMTGLLSDVFNNYDKQFRNKLRLAYEYCFYEREHEFIECVYERAHHEHVESLETDVKRLKNLPIKLLKLPMKDEWWHEIFEQRIHICELNDQPFKPLVEENGTVRKELNGGVNNEKINGKSNGEYHSDDDILSDDDLEGLDVDFPFIVKDKQHFLDTMSVRSFFISTVRDRSKTFNHGYHSDESLTDDEFPMATNRQTSRSCSAKFSTSAPATIKPKISILIDQWKDNDIPEDNSINKTTSKSDHELSIKRKSPSISLQKGDTFEDHFGSALQHMKDMFKAVSPVAKLKCLTAALKKIADKVSELRMRDGKDSFSSPVTAEDLLPLLILMMLQMDPCDAASMWPQLAMLEDLMAPCLSSGCHGWALVEFQMAQRILVDLCSQF